MMLKRLMNRHCLYSLCQCTDMLRRGATAASYNGCTCLHKPSHRIGKHIRSHLVYSFTILKLRKPGIWLCNKRHCRVLCHFLNQSYHLSRSRRAVHTDCIHSKWLQHNNCCLRRCTKKSPAILVVGECHHNRQVAHLFYSKHCRSALLKTHHCLNYKNICARRIKDPRLLLVHLQKLLKHQIPEWKKLSAGHRHICCYKCPIPDSLLWQANQCSIYLVNFLL